MACSLHSPSWIKRSKELVGFSLASFWLGTLVAEKTALRFKNLRYKQALSTRYKGDFVVVLGKNGRCVGERRSTAMPSCLLFTRMTLKLILILSQTQI